MNWENIKGKALNILVLEDSSHDFEIIRELLLDAGYDLHTERVDAEKDFVSMLAGKKFDIILADFKLPGFDAFKALEHSRQICPDVPFICVSGTIGEETAVELMKLGALDYILKDRLHRLPFAVKRALDEAGETRALREAEQALRESEEKYRSIFENVVEGIFQTEPEGRFISVNPAMAHIHGYGSPEEMISGVNDIGGQLYVHPEDRERYGTVLQEQGVIMGFEAQVYRRDGSVIWTSANTRAVKDADGNVLYFEGTAEDITNRKKTEEQLRLSNERLRKNLVGTIKVVSMMLEIRDPYSAGHQRRVSSLARSMAREMGLCGDAIEIIRMAGSIHDIGKMSIPAEILSKSTKLSDIEMQLIRIHPRTGYDILKVADLPYPVAEIVLQHHERLDGSGYPQGLKAGEILLEAQIISVADVVEAMVSHRPYRPAWEIETALEEIGKNRGVLYRPEVVDACLRLFREERFKFE